MKIILFIWIKIKYLYAVLRGYIHPLKQELAFIKKTIKSPYYNDLTNRGMKYQRDFLDSQYDSITAFQKKKDDCDGFNRIAQVYYHLQGYKAYLVSYIADPFEKTHTTCVLEKNGYFVDADYGYMGKIFASTNECIKAIAERYNSKMVCFVAQDIAWEIVKDVK